MVGVMRERVSGEMAEFSITEESGVKPGLRLSFLSYGGGWLNRGVEIGD
jgi:hypothetical protein